MNFTQDILLVFLLGIFTQSQNIDLSTNQNLLFLLLLVLSLNTKVDACCREEHHCPNARVNNERFPNSFTNF